MRGRPGALLLVAAMLVAACSGSVAPTGSPDAAATTATVRVPATSPTPVAPASAAATLTGPSPRAARVPREAESLPDCPDTPLFTVLPIDSADFRAFRPLGFPDPAGHILGAKHSSFVINLPGETPVSGKRVRFPSDAWVTQLVSTESAQGSGFQLVFFPCRQFKSYFFHLGSLSPVLEEAFARSAPRCETSDFGRGNVIKKCTAEMRLGVRAGDAVGGSDSFAGVDWGAVDYRVRHAFANPARYDGDYPSYVSPVEYAAPDVRAAIEPKLGSYDGQVRRTDPPVAGSLMQDVPGTAQGNWFTPGSTFMNTPDFSIWLALLHDYVDTRLPLFSMGSSVPGLRIGLYGFTPETSGTVNRDFADVRPDGRVYCYERFLPGRTRSGLNLAAPPGVIVLDMPTATTLRVESQQGAACGGARSISARATTFER